MQKIYMLAVCIAAVTALPAAAQDVAPGPVNTGAASTHDSTFSVAVTGGTLGIGPEIGWRLSDHVGIRGSATFLNIGGSFESDDSDYDGKIKLNSIGGMVDLYPFGGNFRVSGGARANNNAVEVSATPTGTTEVGDRSYTAAQVGTLSGRAEPSRFSPALTLGWSGSNRRGFMFGFEAGALFQGAFKLDEFRASGSAQNDATFRADLERERQSLQADVDKVKVFPILQLSIGYRF